MNYDNIAEQLRISRDYAEEVQRRLIHNETIAEYFEVLYEETGNLRCIQLANDVYNCNRFWAFDRYDGHRVYDLTGVNLCHSRFCSNCQKMIQASRLMRFAPVLDAALADHDLYHIVFTIPNISGRKLAAHVRIMSRAFRRLIRFLSGDFKIRDLPFAQYGFYGCLRSLEVTYNNRRKDFHPHYHCIFALRKDLQLVKTITNEYSYDYERDSFTGRTRRVFRRKFSEFEVDLQKLWRALIEQETAKAYKALTFEEKLGPRVRVPEFAVPVAKVKKATAPDAPITRDRLEKMPLGYSCIADRVEIEDGEIKYYEVFKYAFKLTSDEKELLSFEQFKTLYYALKGARTMQGYGAWYNLKCEDTIDESVSEFYAVYRAYLLQSDDPVRVRLALGDVVQCMDQGEYKFISRRNLQRRLNDLSESDRQELEQRAATLPVQPARRPDLPDTSLAYYRYLQHKRTSPLFRELGYAPEPDTGKPIIRLTYEQLAFFPRFFGT